MQHNTSVAIKAATGSIPARISSACCAGECFVRDTPQLVMLWTLYVSRISWNSVPRERMVAFMAFGVRASPVSVLRNWKHGLKKKLGLH